MKNIFTFKNFNLLIIVFCCLFATNAFAQKPIKKPVKRPINNQQMPASKMGKPSKSKIAQLKIAYITKEVDLTEKEAQAFWPKYNFHEKKIQDIKSKLNDAKQKEVSSIGDKEKEKIMLERMKLESEKAEMKKKRYEDLKKVLSPTKISKVLAAEDGFVKYMFRQYKGRK